jgi:hypothetical protein
VSSTPAQVQKSQTPILDRLLPVPDGAKRRSWNKIPRYIASNAILWGLLLFFLSGQGAWLKPIQLGILNDIQQVARSDWSGIRVVVTLVAMICLWFLALPIHECGHLIAGLAMGFRFKYMRVRSYQIDRSFRISRVALRNQLIGEVRFYAHEMKEHRFRHLIMVLAGPGSNLLIGLAVLCFPFEKSLISGAFILSCLYLGTFNLGPWAPDGRGIIAVLLKRKHHQAKLALVEIWDLYEDGVEQKNLSPVLIQQAASLKEKSPVTFAAHLIAFRDFYQRRDFESAAASLENCFRWSPWAPEKLRKKLVYSAVVLQACKGQIESAEQWFAELPPETEITARLEAEAVIMEARGNLKGALDKIAECEENLTQEDNLDSNASRLKQLRKWKLEIEERVSTAPLQQA